VNVTVWCEGVLPQSKPDLAAIYPEGMEVAIAEGLRALLPHATIRTATLGDPDSGLSDAVLDDTDVLLWWGHLAHDDVPEDRVAAVHERVLGGMGLIALHSAHFSTIFRRLMGTTCSLGWRNDAGREVIWSVAPTHPIARDIPGHVILPAHETYAEFFDVPRPDDVVFISNHDGGEAFRSGLTFTRGLGRIFYFSPGDESYPIFRNEWILKIIANATNWAHPSSRGAAPTAVHVAPPA